MTDWRTISGSVRVPDGADQLVLTLNAFDQLDPADEVSYDDVVVLPVGASNEGPDLARVRAGEVTLDNYSFEDGLSGFDVSSTSVVAPVNDGYSGANGARVGPDAGGFSRAFPIGEGEVYQLRGFAKRVGETSQAYFGVRFVDAAGMTLPGSFKNVTIETATYRDYSVTGIAPAGAAALVAYLWKEDAGSFALTDDWRLRIGPALEAAAPTIR